MKLALLTIAKENTNNNFGINSKIVKKYLF